MNDLSKNDKIELLLNNFSVHDILYMTVDDEKLDELIEEYHLLDESDESLTSEERNDFFINDYELIY